MIEKFKLNYLTPRTPELSIKINEIIDILDSQEKSIDKLSLNFQEKICNLVDSFDSLRACVDEIEEKAILKPDYEPDEVDLRCIAEKGTFEWAIVQVKSGNIVKRKEWKHHLFCSSTHLKFDIFTPDILADDWELVE